MKARGELCRRRAHTPPADPSSGLKALALLLHVCQSVDLYGFVASTSSEHAGYLSWYYDKYPGYKVLLLSLTCTVLTNAI